MADEISRTHTDNEAQPPTHSRMHWLLLLIPYLWCVGAIPLVSQVDYIFGSVPFLLVWMLAGVVISSGVVAVVYAVDKSRGDLEAI